MSAAPLVVFANNRVGWWVTRYLRERGEEIAAVVVHPRHRQRFGDEIMLAAGVPASRVIDGARLREPATVERLAALEPRYGVSALFGYILRPELLALFAGGCVNVHPSYLPFGRGANPNVWSILEGTPAGATVHWVDAGVDTGDIVARRRVAVRPDDTGETLYRRLEVACAELFEQTWPMIRTGCAPRLPQQADEGTSHRLAELAAVDALDLDRQYTGRELLDILRARTFPPYKGAYYEVDGRRIYIRVALRPDDPSDLEIIS